MGGMIDSSEDAAVIKEASSSVENGGLEQPLIQDNNKGTIILAEGVLCTEL